MSSTPPTDHGQPTLVIGAGPAGLATARALALGASVVVVVVDRDGAGPRTSRLAVSHSMRRCVHQVG